VLALRALQLLLKPGDSVEMIISPWCI